MMAPDLMMTALFLSHTMSRPRSQAYRVGRTSFRDPYFTRVEGIGELCPFQLHETSHRTKNIDIGGWGRKDVSFTT